MTSPSRARRAASLPARRKPIWACGLAAALSAGAFAAAVPLGQLVRPAWCWTAAPATISEAQASPTPAGATAATAALTTAEPATSATVQRSEHHYAVPARLQVQRSDGRFESLKSALADGRPVVMSFMYSSCATVCPITNQTLLAFSKLLGDSPSAANVVSISIDPDHDTAQRLAAYARLTGGAGSYLSSDPATSEAVQRSFDVWRSDKMNHQPVFLLRATPDSPWVRLDGLVSPQRLLSEFRRLPSGST